MIDILAFIVLIGVLITVHEFGHYIVGKLCELRLRFSPSGLAIPSSKRNGGNRVSNCLIPFEATSNFLDKCLAKHRQTRKTEARPHGQESLSTHLHIRGGTGNEFAPPVCHYHSLHSAS